MAGRLLTFTCLAPCTLKYLHPWICKPYVVICATSHSMIFGRDNVHEVDLARCSVPPKLQCECSIGPWPHSCTRKQVPLTCSLISLEHFLLLDLALVCLDKLLLGLTR